jgi:hypothetical protein
MESNVSLEKKLQFVFVIERDYVKSWTEGMCKVCLVVNGGSLVLKVSGENGEMVETYFQTKWQKGR